MRLPIALCPLPILCLRLVRPPLLVHRLRLHLTFCRLIVLRPRLVYRPLLVLWQMLIPWQTLALHLNPFLQQLPILGPSFVQRRRRLRNGADT
ncbi:MAG: hypothetical protein F4011_09360 [Acidimicrobiaceae bacterium]|nr:hypothetical protein [Acidimicrobiaceae bacterium]MYL04371.1 hypothetical protein [Acidimicrobiaceae bacterium]